MAQEGWGKGSRDQLIAWWWNFSVSFIIKELLSVIDLRRGVSESCGIREPNCSEVLHYSTGILTWCLARACQFLSGGLGVAILISLPLPHHNHRHTQSYESHESITIQATCTCSHTHTEQKHQSWTLPFCLEVADCCFARWSTSHPAMGLIRNELTDAAVSFYSQRVIYGHSKPFPAKQQQTACEKRGGRWSADAVK